MRIGRVGIVALWLGVMALVTHWPADATILAAVPSGPFSDKPLHFGLYFVLGWLVWYRRQDRAIELASLMFLAAADEYTQPWVGRTADLADWCADVLGVTAALGVLRLTFNKPDTASSEPPLQK